jgi:hypothetical protein
LNLKGGLQLLAGLRLRCGGWWRAGFRGIWAELPGFLKEFGAGEEVSIKDRMGGYS